MVANHNLLQIVRNLEDRDRNRKETGRLEGREVEKVANHLNESASLEKASKEGFFLCSDLLALSEAELLVLSVAHHSPTLL